MPFGLGLADWDVLLTNEELEMFFRQLNIVNTSAKTTLALVVHWADAGRVKAAMEAGGYQSVHPFYVYKPNQNQKGTGCFIFAVEVILVGYLSDAKHRDLVFEERNPLGRHNLLFGHNLRGSRFQLSGAQEPVNTCQKHPGIAHALASICARQGANALVIGSGSGSDIIGCLRAGLDVIAIDKDAGQFHGCKARLLAYQANLESEQKTERKELTQVQRVKEVARGMASWDPAPAESEAEAVDELMDIVQPAPEPSVVLPELSETEKCVVCGKDVDVAVAKSCMADEVCVMGQFLHEDCVLHCSVDGCEKFFCCARHLDAHHEAVHQ